MNPTKRSFLKAGAILAIISAVFMVFTGISMFTLSSSVDEKFILEMYEMEYQYVKVPELDGGYHIEYFEDEDDLRPTIVEDDEIIMTAKIAKGAIIAMSVITIGIAVVQYIFGSKILKDVKKNIASKKHIITLLVFSILSNSTLTMAFMIVALCIKDKKITLENINEIASQNGEQLTIDQLTQTEQNKEDNE